MGEDRRSRERRSGIGDRRLDTPSYQVNSDHNRETKYTSLTAFIITIIAIVVITVVAFSLAYFSLNKRISNIESQISVDSGSYSDEDYTTDESYDIDESSVEENTDSSNTSSNT